MFCFLYVTLVRQSTTFFFGPPLNVEIAVMSIKLDLKGILHILSGVVSFTNVALAGEVSNLVSPRCALYR